MQLNCCSANKQANCITGCHAMAACSWNFNELILSGKSIGKVSDYPFKLLIFVNILTNGGDFECPGVYCATFWMTVLENRKKLINHRSTPNRIGLIYSRSVRSQPLRSKPFIEFLMWRIWCAPLTLPCRWFIVTVFHTFWFFVQSFCHWMSAMRFVGEKGNFNEAKKSKQTKRKSQINCSTFAREWEKSKFIEN